VSRSGGDLPAGTALPTQGFDPLDGRRRGRPMEASRAGRAVGETCKAVQAEARGPLVGGLDADSESRRHGARRLAFDGHPPRQFGSTMRRQAGILVDVHSVPPIKREASATSASSVRAGSTTS
jgi:hypothetical protein